jgi:hypothetical protein
MTVRTIKLIDQLHVYIGTAEVDDGGRFRSPAYAMVEGKLYKAEEPHPGQDTEFYRETPFTVGALVHAAVEYDASKTPQQNVDAALAAPAV